MVVVVGMERERVVGELNVGNTLVWIFGVWMMVTRNLRVLRFENP